MAGPWEKYQAQPTQVPQAQEPAAAGPWSKYQPAAPSVQEAPATDLDAMVNAAATKYQIDPRLFRAQIEAESSMNPRAVSKAGAKGLGQLMPGTAADLGVTDPFDPAQNLEGSAKYMRQLMDRYEGDADRALAAYNWGMGNVDKFGTKMLPKETRDYLARIKSKAGDEAFAPRQQQAQQQPSVEDQTREMLLGAQYRQGRPAPGTPLAEQINAESQNIAAGLTSTADAAGQLVSAAMPDALERRLMPTGQTFNENLAARDKAIEEQRKASGLEGPSLGYGLGVVASPANALIGPAAQGAARAVQAGPRAARVIEPAVAGALGAAQMPVTPDSEGSIAGGKAAQVATGAVLGPVTDVLMRAGINTAGHIAGAIKNKMTSPEVQELIDLGKKWDVDFLAGDIDQNRRILRGIEGQLLNSRIPGLNISLEGQQAQGRAAAEKFLKIQNEELQKLSFQGLGKIKEIAAGDGKRAAEARTLLRMVDEAGDDVRKVIQTSGNLKWLRMKLSGDQLFDEVERMAGKADVNPASTIAALKKADKQADKTIDIDRGTIDLINNWKLRLQRDPADAGPNTFMRMREFLTDIRNRVDNATTNGTTKSGQLWLQDVAKAVQKDLDSFANRKPGLKAANDRANKFYMDRVVPFQASDMAKALRSDNPDAVWSSFVRSGAEWRGNHAQQALFKALDEKGKAAVRAGMVEDAFRQATDPEHFTPTGFNKVMRSTGYETFFQGPARREVDGLMHIMDHIRRSDPDKLAQFTPMLGGLGLGGMAGMATGTISPAAVATGLAGTGAMKWLVTSDAGRRLLYSANLYKPGSPKADQALAKILETARNQFTRSTGTAAGLEQGEPGTVLP